MEGVERRQGIYENRTGRPLGFKTRLTLLKEIGLTALGVEGREDGLGDLGRVALGEVGGESTRGNRSKEKMCRV